MCKRIALAALLVLVPSLAWGQTAESYLPPQSQIYIRFDGMKTHQAAFQKTAAGKMLQGETGEFLSELWKYAQELIQLGTQNQPDIGPWITDATGLVRDFYENGIVIAIEAEKVTLPVSARGVVVFPKAAGERGTLLPLIQKITVAAKAEVKDVKVGPRFVHQVQMPPVSFGWWAQGDDVVLYLGTDEPAAYARQIDGKQTGIAAHPLYKKVAEFKDFTTASRGYVDLKGLTKVAGAIKPEVDSMLDDLGLKSLNALTFVSGFDGLVQRSVTEITTEGPRKGLLSLSSMRKLRLKDLPPLPSDLTGFSASTLDISKSYDVIVDTIEGVVKVAAPEQLDNVREGIKAIEGVLGVQLKEDLFANFGDLYISYASPSEGIIGFGSASVFQVKDTKKVAEALDKLVKGVPGFPGFELSWRKRDYKGGEIYDLQFKANQFASSLGSIGFYKGWLIYSAYPQTVKGFILRGNGELPVWQVNDELKKVLGTFPDEFSSISISDPRPTIQTLLAVTPVLLNFSNGFINTALPGARPFDLSLIPPSQLATMGLFPNVTVTTDNGKTIRSETRASLSFP